jgi:hypothetical protein
MTDQQTHLKSVVDQQKVLFKEIQELTNELAMKKEVVTKLQGIYEYLTGIGVTLPEESTESIEKEEKTEE